MYNRAANVYRQVSIDSAPSTRILDELYGAILSDCRTAAGAIRIRDMETKGKCISRALAILNELETALDHRVAPEITQNLSALYNFVRTRLFTANVNMEAGALEDVERVILPLRDAFQQAARR